jgi:hypothetical protein
MHQQDEQVYINHELKCSKQFCAKVFPHEIPAQSGMVLHLKLGNLAPGANS